MSAVLPPSGPLLGFPFSSPGRDSSQPSSPHISASVRQGHKRRHGDDDSDDEMAVAPDTSPVVPARTLEHAKRARKEIIGRPLPLSRQLEPLDARSLKNLLCTLVDKHQFLADEINSMISAPTVNSSLEILNKLVLQINDAFPYKGDPTGDYAFLRVRPHITEFLDAVSDYTPHFLPPREQQIGNSLQFLDGVTGLVERLPTWQSGSNNYLKHAAFEELSRAWCLVIREALKRAGGIVLEYGGWRDKIGMHDEASGGRLHDAVAAVEQGLGESNLSPRRFGRVY
ncbi:Cut8 six-helix bundle-domain-containing protein [Lipomyces japonicus]|uniref:Cut8 six-helix bundle-domain-containing protein n=1 Tax=Lipomyces japonicus TaxID=56871 RepID=UPI0034CEE34A